MTALRILYGLARLPATLADDDDRLPAVNLGAFPLRLNSVPLPVAAWGDVQENHGARMGAARNWLLGGCGDYNQALRRGVSHYLGAVTAHIELHREALAAGLTPFHGLYRPEDWYWSALRPLPRAWWREHGVWKRADLAFWTGNEVMALEPRAFETGEFPAAFQNFWQGEVLPVSPFRRAFPDGVSLGD